MNSEKTTVWMAVSKDETRLPIAIADTAKELIIEEELKDWILAV